jgi:hypothetical protein
MFSALRVIEGLESGISTNFLNKELDFHGRAIHRVEKRIFLGLSQEAKLNGEFRAQRTQSPIIAGGTGVTRLFVRVRFEGRPARRILYNKAR